MAAEQSSILLHGVDFTSAPRPRKGITIASGHLQGDSFVLEALTTLYDFSSFVEWLRQPGPWLGGFDFPFSFPRELIELLGWPSEWSALIQYVRQLDRAALRNHFKAVCRAIRQRAKNPGGGVRTSYPGDGSSVIHVEEPM